MEVSTPISLAIGIVGVLLNVVVALAIAFSNEMSTPTYKFMNFLAIADIETLLGFAVGPPLLVALGYKGEFFTIPMHMTMGYFLIPGFLYSSIMLSLVAFARWMHFVKPHLVDTFLTNKRQIFTILASFLVPHLLYAPVLFDYSLLVPVGDSGWFIFGNSSYAIFLESFDEVVDHISVICQACFHTMSCIWIWKMRKQILDPQLRKQHKKELKLFILCVVDWVINVILVVMYDLTVYSSIEGWWLTWLGEKVMILNHTDLAILYLFMNKRLRSNIVKFIKKIFWWKKSTTAVTSLPATATTGARSTTRF